MFSIREETNDALLSSSSRLSAAKIAHADKVYFLNEYRKLSRAYETFPHKFIRPVSESFQVCTIQGVDMVYYLVGIPCIAANIRRVEAFYAHTHQRHNPRRCNLVAVNNGKDFKWIDVRDTSVEEQQGENTLADLIRQDLISLLESSITSIGG